jgi:hypothetical protein
VSRTRDLRFRKPLLYPSELRGRTLVCLSLHAAAFPWTQHRFPSKKNKRREFVAAKPEPHQRHGALLFPLRELSVPQNCGVMLIEKASGAPRAIAVTTGQANTTQRPASVCGLGVNQSFDLFVRGVKIRCHSPANNFLGAALLHHVIVGRFHHVLVRHDFRYVTPQA